MRLESLHTLYVERLRDMRDAEDQILKALPKMIEHVNTEELRGALRNHLEETRQQAARLQQIFDDLDESPTGKKCKGIAGVIEEASDLMKEKGDAMVVDAGIIDGAQHIEHYEIAGYGTLVTFAGLLGYDQQQSLLETSLQEEKRADETLTEIAERTINPAALRGEEEREVARSVEGEGTADRPVRRERPVGTELPEGRAGDEERRL
ncbi:MAG: YciE/YciF ferroxidase family protein [Gemmatimonadaceae bacterium]